MNNILIEKINKKEAEICVIGLGYIGLPLSLSFAYCGFKVLGIDIDKQKINKLNNGLTPIYEPGLEELIKRNYNQGRLKFSSDLLYVKYTIALEIDFRD